jgi:hypothetical protein
MMDPSQTPVQLIPLTKAEQAFGAANSPSTGCAAATDQYCGATFAFWPGPVVADPAHGRILFMYGKYLSYFPRGTGHSNWSGFSSPRPQRAGEGCPVYLAVLRPARRPTKTIAHRGAATGYVATVRFLPWPAGRLPSPQRPRTRQAAGPAAGWT